MRPTELPWRLWLAGMLVPAIAGPILIILERMSLLVSIAFMLALLLVWGAIWGQLARWWLRVRHTEGR